jgi:hypothetical protein
MPLENLEEEGLEKNPNLELALWKFLLSLPDHSGDKKLQSKLMEAIIGDSMYIFTNSLQFYCSVFFGRLFSTHSVTRTVVSVRNVCRFIPLLVYSTGLLWFESDS